MIKISIKKIVTYLIASMLIIVLADILVYQNLPDHLPETLANNKLYLWFSTNNECNLPTFFSSFLLMISSALLFFIAKYEKKKCNWYLLSAVFFLATLDEMVCLHEWYDLSIKTAYSPSNLFITNGWVSLWFVIIMVLAACNIFLFFNLPKKTKQLFMLSAFIYLTGALILEMIGGKYYEINFEIYKSLTLVEEMFEMSGSILFVYTWLDYLRTKNTLKIEIK